MSLKINGSTSGSVTLDAPATGGNVSFTLPGSVGSSGQLLSTNGSGVLSFVNGGKILQVVRATDSTNRTTTSTSYTDVTGMSVSITPTLSSSTVLIIASFSARTNSDTASELRGVVRITDSSNNAISGAEFGGVGNIAASGSDIRRWVSPVQLFAWATPATTSAVTYKLRFLTENASTTLNIENGSMTGQMFAIEVAA